MIRAQPESDFSASLPLFLLAIAIAIAIAMTVVVKLGVNRIPIVCVDRKGFRVGSDLS